MGYYSSQGSNAVCLSCSPQIANCATCGYINTNQSICISCQSGFLIEEWSCVSNCSLGNSSGQYCISYVCLGLADCAICSGVRCIQCNGSYVLDGNYNCVVNQVITPSTTPAALAEVPVPFPFVIATLMVMVLGFFLRHNYSKMFSPLFVYSLAGCL